MSETAPWDSTAAMLRDAESVVQQCLPLTYASCDAQLQSDAINTLNDLAGKVNVFRQSAAEKLDEFAANTAFVCARYIGGVGRFLEMWLRFKSDEMNTAWNCLVDAQSEVNCALRFCDDGTLRYLAQSLQNAEGLLFPPQQFVSSSLSYTSSVCTICDGVYGECGHVAGRLYLGVMCSERLNNGVQLGHLALVDSPADKGCRVTEFQNGVHMHCSLTRLPIGKAVLHEKGLRFSAVALRSRPNSSNESDDSSVRPK